MAKTARRKKTKAGFAVDNASLTEVVRALGEGKVMASGLVRTYLARIEAYDHSGLRLNSVREVNPDALTIAGKPRWRQAVGRTSRWPACRSW